jgi:hypothetical protein
MRPLLQAPLNQPSNSAMDIRHEFNRIGHLFNDGVEKTQKKAGHWAGKGTKRANELSRRMRDQLDTGTRNAVSVEESMVRHMRENPALYIIGAALLIGALIAKLILESRQNSETPLL